MELGAFFRTSVLSSDTSLRHSVITRNLVAKLVSHFFYVIITARVCAILEHFLFTFSLHGNDPPFLILNISNKDLLKLLC